MKRLWERRFAISQFDVSGVPFPAKVLKFDPRIRLIASGDEECTACIAFDAEEPSLDGLEQKTMFEIANVYSLLSGFSIQVKPLGARTINSLKELGGPYRPLTVKVKAQYPARKLRKYSQNLLAEWQRTTKVWARLRSTFKRTDRRFLKLAIGYYYQSGLHSIPLEEAFVDAAIGLEALFNDGPQDIAYKLAVRGALVLRCLDHTDAGSQFQSLKELYKKRNEIVHGTGGKLEPDDQYRIRRLLRSSLKGCLALGLEYNKSAIISLIDEAVIDDAARSKLKKEIKSGVSTLGL